MSKLCFYTRINSALEERRFCFNHLNKLYPRLNLDQMWSTGFCGNLKYMNMHIKIKTNLDCNWTSKNTFFYSHARTQIHIYSCICTDTCPKREERKEKQTNSNLYVNQSLRYRATKEKPLKFSWIKLQDNAFLIVATKEQAFKVLWN